jgi:sterol O-acyltransferase
MDREQSHPSPYKPIDTRKVEQIKAELQRTMEALNKLEQSRGDTFTMAYENRLLGMSDKASQILDDVLMSYKDNFNRKVQETVVQFNARVDALIQEVKDTIKPKEQEEPKNRVLLEKVFKRQSAPISKLLYSRDFQTIYNIFIAIMVNIGIAEMARDLLDSNEVWGLYMLRDNFDKTNIVIQTWLVAFILSFFPVVLVQMWNKGVKFIVLLPFYVLLQIACFAHACWAVRHHDLPIASSIVVMSESIRFGLKMHSYRREKCMHSKPNPYQKFIPRFARELGVTEDDLQLPSITIDSFSDEISKYLFFLFVPTLIYRDSYPKLNRSIRRYHLAVNTFNFFGCIIYTTLIFKAFCVPEFKNAANHITSYNHLLLSWIRATLPGTLVFLLLFFGVMHSWFSMWAEILNFPDRKFYDSWWKATNMGTFFRKLSVIIYEWLHTYVYLDAMRFTGGLFGQTAARVTVFLVSGLLFEVVVDISLGFFYPILFTLIAGPGMFLLNMQNKRTRIYNVLVWFVLILTMGLMMTLYSLEFYARENGEVDLYPQYGYMHYAIPQWMVKLNLINIK